jgi:hypothetical protein
MVGYCDLNIKDNMDKTKWFLDIINEDGRVLKSVIVDELLTESEMDNKAKQIIKSYPWNQFNYLDYAIARFN